MDLASFSAAYNGAKIAKESLSAAFQFKVDKEAEKKINEALDKLGPIQDSLFEMREELFRLQDENRELKEQLSEQQNWQNRLESYELKETSGSAIVYESKKSPVHYACPNCIEKKEIQILQNKRNCSGKFICPGCDKLFPINPEKQIEIPNPGSGGWT